MRRKLIVILSVILAILFGYLIYEIVNVYIQESNAHREYTLYGSKSFIDTSNISIDNVVISTDGNEVDKEELLKQKYAEQLKIQKGINWHAFKNINSRFIGIISIPELNIWYPVVQNSETDSDYYLTHTYSKEENASGAIFLDYLFNSDLSDNHNIIFGHNMRNLSMFGILKSLIENQYDREFYIYIYQEDSLSVYKIYAAYLTKPDSMDYYAQLPKEDDYVSYYNNAVNSEVYKYNDDAINEAFYNRNGLLTLSTCHANNHSDYTVVQSILIERIIIGDE